MLAQFSSAEVIHFVCQTVALFASVFHKNYQMENKMMEKVIWLRWWAVTGVAAPRGHAGL